MAKLQKNTIDKKELLADIERIKKSKNADEIDAIMAKYEKGLAEMDRRNAKKAEAPAKPKTGRYNGKYEVYQAADGYAYRLKASNGEILATSEIYTTRDGVLKAIDTVKKNVEVGEIRVFADKHGKFKFKLIAQNHRVLVFSSNYQQEAGAQRASESFKKFALKADIVDVEIKDDDLASATKIKITATEDKTGGKYILEEGDGEYSWVLKASNGEILVQMEGYTSKPSALASIEKFKQYVAEGTFKSIKDKSGHSLFKLYTQSNRVAAVGEAYSTKTSAVSAANSVVSFYKLAELVDLEEIAKKEARKQAAKERAAQKKAEEAKKAEEKANEPKIEEKVEPKEEPIVEEALVEEVPQEVAEEPFEEVEEPAEEVVEETPEEVVDEAPEEEPVETPTEEEPAEEPVEEKAAEEPVEEKAEEEPEEVKEAPKPKKPRAKKAEKKEEPKKAAAKKESKKAKEEPKPAPKKAAAKKEEAPKTGRYNGKYEVYQAADGYAYRLKASNGEVLATSEIYTTRDGILRAINTVKKNVEVGELRVFADKKGKFKFKMLSGNHRVLLISANYAQEAGANRAVESFKKFALKADIVDVEIKDDDLASATKIKITSTEDKAGGKYEIEESNGEFSWDLKASNGEILVQMEGYTSKASLLGSIEKFKQYVEEGTFKSIKDKTGHYQYKLYTKSNRVAAVGESYKTKTSAVSAANSVVSFYKLAEVVDLNQQAKAEAKAKKAEEKTAKAEKKSSKK